MTLKIADLVRRESLEVPGDRPGVPLIFSPAYEAVGIGLAIARMYAGRWQITHLESGNYLVGFPTRRQALAGLNVLVDSDLDWTANTATIFKPTLYPCYFAAVQKARGEV